MTELKKFEAPTLAEALKVVKRELGPEAIVLSTRHNKSGWGLMNQSSVEVTATVSRDALERKEKAERGLSDEQRETLYKKPAQKISQAYDVLSGSRLERRMREAESLTSQATSTGRTQQQRQQANAQAQARNNPAAALLARESANSEALARKRQSTPTSAVAQRRYIDIQDDESPAEQATLRSSDRTYISPQSAQHHHHSQPMAQQMVRPTSTSHSSAGSILPKLLAELIEAGIQQDIVRELGDELKVVMLKEHISREDVLRLQLGRIIMSRVRVARPLSERLRVPATPRMITFLGPTGVGKTTTIAKIAAELVIHQKRPVTLATTDTFKIAAVEQLQTYANILRIPLEVCPDKDSLSNLAAQLGPDDVVLIDTAGYGPRDEKKLVELQDLLSSIRTEKHLCLASTTRDQDLMQAVRRFKMFEPDYLVCTKLDETNIFGNVFNMAARTHMPLSYFTMGQRVPEDMEVATKERLADLLLNLAGGDASWTKRID